MKIAGRGFEMRVPQQCLNHQQVHSLIQQMGRKRVAQRMRVNRLGDPGFPRRRLASFENAIGCDGTIRLPAGEQPLGGTLPPPVRHEHLAERLGQHHLPVLVAFAAANPDHVAFAVQIGHLQFGHFRYAESRAIHRGQHRPVFKVLRALRAAL